VTIADGKRLVAVLGAGSIGLRHLKNLLSLGFQQLVCFEPDSARRELVAQTLPVTCLAQLDAVWEFEPSVVFITAPTALHLPLALAAVKHGAHIFIEKPLSHSMNGLELLDSEAKLKGLVSMVGCNMRFHPGPATVRRLLEEKALGTLLCARLQASSFLPRWRPAQDYRKSYSASPDSGGAILDCIHEIDLADWYFGPGIVLASAILPASCLGLSTDGTAEILIRHESGVLASLHLNFMQRDCRRGCQIAGTHGTIYWDFTMQRVEVFGEDGTLQRSLSEPEGWEINQMYMDEVAYFLECVDRRQQTANSIADARRVLALALDARNQGARVMQKPE
jgi:predicted dehydrogenase